MSKKVKDVVVSKMTNENGVVTSESTITYNDGTTEQMSVRKKRTGTNTYTGELTIGKSKGSYNAERYLKKETAKTQTIHLKLDGTFDGKKLSIDKDFEISKDVLQGARGNIVHYEDPTSCSGNFWCDVSFDALCQAGISTFCFLTDIEIITLVCGIVCVGDPFCWAGCEATALAVGVPTIVAAMCDIIENTTIAGGACSQSANWICSQIDCP